MPEPLGCAFFPFPPVARRWIDERRVFVARNKRGYCRRAALHMYGPVEVAGFEFSAAAFSGRSCHARRLLRGDRGRANKLPLFLSALRSPECSSVMR
ncbi:hypothetical protein MRX96_004446 [Rhipicephalus microplus]